VVTAPTHEQVYSTDPVLAAKAQKSEHDADTAAFTATLPALPPVPAPIDPSLKSDALKQAKADFAAAAQARKAAEAERKTAIAAEEKRIAPQVAAAGDRAGTIDSLSGPMFQRAGTTLYTSEEMQTLVDGAYADLPEAQRRTMAKKLTAPDRGGPDDQQGQRVKTVKPYSIEVKEPASLAEGKIAYAATLKANFFTAKSMEVTRAASEAGTDLTVTFSGTKKPPGEPAQPTATRSKTT
jgi:hypothetical protein